jgi:hypothetical protein
MNMQRSIRILAPFLSALLLSATAAATEPASPPVGGLNARVAELEALVKRLHGNKIAVINRNISGSFSGDATATVEILVQLMFCAREDVLAAQPGEECNQIFGTPIPGILLEATIPLGSNPTGTVIVIDSGTPGFDEAAALLTNGVEDTISVRHQICEAPGVGCGGGGSDGPESRQFGSNQVSSGAGTVDLAGVELGSIAIALDTVFLTYGSSTDTTLTNVDYRILFNLAD